MLYMESFTMYFFKLHYSIQCDGPFWKNKTAFVFGIFDSENLLNL